MSIATLESTGIMEVALQGRSFLAVPDVDGVSFRPFWDYFQKGLWESDTLSMIDTVAADRTIFLDIGGWIGPTALWAAFRQKTVYTFEPDPVALKALRRNLELNPVLADHISVIPSAVGRADGDLELFSAKPGMSETSVFQRVQRNNVPQDFGNRIVVPVIDINQFIRSLSPNEHKIFIKMDIEGAEFELLPHLAESVRKYDIVVAVTIHAPNIVQDTLDITMASRILKIGKCLEPYSDMHWYTFEEGHFVEVKRFDFLIKTLNNLNTDASVIVSANPLKNDVKPLA